ncbi:MAG: DOMON domain-containing protein [Candidatus Heimdallarchaeota archaeon]
MKKRMMIFFIGLLLIYWTSSSSRQLTQAVGIPYVADNKVIIDGTIGSGEYVGSYHETITDMYLYWEHDGTNLYIGMESPGTGWVGIGLGPQGAGMDGSNMIVGYVDDAGSLLLLDEVGVGWEHHEDTTLGGTDDILAKAGSESNGKTIIEFVFPLNSGDELDHSFEVSGTYGFFLGYQASADDFTSYHTKRSKTIDIYIISGSTELPEPETKVSTTISINVPASVIVDQAFTVVARLHDEMGAPVEGEPVEFYRITTFGKLELGQVMTNSKGDATLECRMRMAGSVEFEASYGGSANRGSSSASVSLLVQPLIQEEPARIALPGISMEISTDRFISLLGLGVIFWVLGSVALTFAYVGYQIISLYREKEKPDEEFVEPLRYEWRR